MSAPEETPGAEIDPPGGDEPTLPPPGDDDEATLAPPSEDQTPTLAAPTALPEEADAAAKTVLMTEPEVGGGAVFRDLPTQLDPTLAPKLDAWAKTVLANSGQEDPGLTFKLVDSAPGDEEGRPTLSPTVTILRAPAAPVPGEFDYRITETIGRGGMGEIHGAEQRVLQRQVALKTLLPKLRDQPSAEFRFVAEALITGRLQHPNIVPVHDLGRTREGDLFMGMKLVRGETLSDLLKREPVTDPARLRRVLDILLRICDAMAYAHGQGVLHRDLKPSNIMVGEFGEVQVMDWGLATEADPAQRTQVESGPCGTPSYMSPEQASGEHEEVGIPADVYLLGAILYEVLTGTPPHRGRSLTATLLAALEGKITPPSERAPERSIPADLEELCLAALAPSVDERLGSVKEFQEGLARHLAHAEAIGLIERARELLEGGADRSQHQLADELSQARVLLTQALEMWPESTEVQDLLSQVTLRQIDVALDRGEARAAGELAAGLEGAPGVAPETLAGLKGAARRQLTRRRNQAVVAALLAVALLFGYAFWTQEVAPELAQEARLEEARDETASKTDEVWDALAAREPPIEITRKLDALRKVLSAARWPREPEVPSDDLRALHAVTTWQALRVGDRHLALARLDGVDPRVQGKLRADVLASMGDRGAQATLDDALAAPLPERWLDRVYDAVKLLYPLNHLPAGALETLQPRLRERLEETGARAGLFEAGSGVPSSLLYAPGERPIRLRLAFERSFLEPSEKKRAGLGERRKRSKKELYLVAFDERTGTELWRYPPPALAEEAERHLGDPVVLQSEEGDLAFVSWGSEILGLDMETGVVRRRFRLFDRVAALVPAGPREMSVFQASGYGRGRSRRITLGVDGWSKQTPGPGDDLIYAISFGLQELERQLVAPQEKRAEDDPERLREELERLEGVARRDPTQPFLSYARGVRLLGLGRRDEGLEALRDLDRADLGPTELALAADRLDEKFQLHDLAERLLERALRLQVERGVNPDLNPLLMGNPALWLRRIATRAAAAGDDERVLRLMALSREVATAIEMDKFFLPFERRWLLERGKTAEAEALSAYEERALRMGGSFMMPDVIAGIDLVILALGLVPLLLLASLLVVVSRTRAARVAALRSLGFRTMGARWAAFVTHPLLRLTHTFLAYATRTERVVLLLGVAAMLSAYVYQSAILNRIAQVASIPMVLGRGELDHPRALEYVFSARDKARRAGRSTAPHTRLIVEGAFLAEELGSAEALLGSLLEEDPGDPFANNNLAILEEAKGEQASALDHYRRAAETPGELGAVARYNLARIEGKQRPALPPPYAAWSRLGDVGQPLRQFAAQTDMMSVLSVSTSRLTLFGDELVRVLGVEKGLASTVSDMASADSGGVFWGDGSGLLNTFFILGARLRIPFLLGGLFALLHLPFMARPRTPPPSPRAVRWLERFGQVADLVLPGSLLLAKGRVALGFLAAAVVPVCLVLIFMARTGGLLYAIALPNFPQPWGELEATDLVVGTGLRASAAVSAVVIAGAYLLAYGQAIRRLLAWRRERKAG